MARHYVQQPSPARYLDDHAAGQNVDRHHRRRTGTASTVGGDSKAAARRWTELRARIRVARSLRHTSQNRLLPPRQSNGNSEVRKTSSASRLEPTKNHQLTGQPLRTNRQSEVISTHRSTSRQSSYTRTPWWKYSGDEDQSNRNDPDVLDTDKVEHVNQQLNSTVTGLHTEHTVDNFRFIDVDRKRIQNEPRYVDENITRSVRKCRRVKSFDEDWYNGISEDDDWRSLNNSVNRTASVKFDSATSRCPEDIVRTSEVDRLRCDDVERALSSTLKRSRSLWTSEPQFAGHSVDELRAIDDLLSLDNDEDQLMDVVSDHEEEQTVHHNGGSEFLQISHELQHLCLSFDDPKTRTDLNLTAFRSTNEPVSSSPQLIPVLMFSTVENETCDENYSAGSSEVAVQLLTDKSRPVCPNSSKLTATNTNVIDTAVVKNRNNRYCNSVSVSHPGPVFRQEEASRSKLLLSVNSFPPRKGLTRETPPANLCLLKPEFTLNVVSFYRAMHCA